MSGPDAASFDGLAAALPGADLVAAGIEALRRGETTEEALLVVIGAWRLRAAGLDVPATPDLETSPEIALYRMIAGSRPADAHSRYNALVRRLVSFERALEHVVVFESRNRCREPGPHEPAGQGLGWTSRHRKTDASSSTSALCHAFRKRSST